MQKSEYTPEEFLKNTEESVNYTYAIPFIKYWDIETKKDTIIIPIINCKILASEGPSKYQLILDKITCRYICSNLTNKKLKYVKVSLISKACTAIKVEVITSIGSINVRASLSEPNPPGPSSFATYRREFVNPLWATFGTCSTPDSPNISAPVEMGEMATYNIIGGNDLAHTLVNIETHTLNSFDVSLNWWDASCHEPWIDPDDDPNACSYTNCFDWFTTTAGGSRIYTQAGIQKYCLQPSDLNSRLISTEARCKAIANSSNKDFVNLDEFVTWGLCLGYNHELWWGYLTIGNKIYRNHVPEEFSIVSCNCTE